MHYFTFYVGLNLEVMFCCCHTIAFTRSGIRKFVYSHLATIYVIASVTEMGFEPMPPKWLVPETSALDHSAILPLLLVTNFTLCHIARDLYF